MVPELKRLKAMYVYEILSKADMPEKLKNAFAAVPILFHILF